MSESLNYEKTAIQQELEDLRNVTPLVNQAYWDNLAGKENPTLEDYMNLIKNIEEPAMIAEKEDTLAICDSVIDSMKRADIIDKELAEYEEEAEEVISSLNVILDGKSGFEITKAYEEALRIANDENIPEMVRKPMMDIVNAIESNKELKDFVNTRGKAMICAENFAKDHPVMLKLHQAKKNLLDIVDTIKSVRASMKAQTTQMINDVKEVARAASIKMTEGYSSIKASVWETSNRALQVVASGYNTAVTEFEKFAEKSKLKVKEVINTAEKFKDKFVDMISLGLHSKLEAGKTKDFYEQNKVLVQEKLDNLRLSYEDGASKDEVLEKSLEKKIASLDKKIKKIEKKETFRGVSHTEYWKNITDEAFLWGKLSDNGRETGYARSPLQASIDGYHGATTFANEMVKKGIELYNTADSAFQKSVDDLCRNTRNKAREVSLMGTNFVANVYDKLAETYNKRARRLGSKQDILISVDKQLYAKKMEIQKILHDLTEVSPFKAPEFVPSPQIVAQIEQLKKLNPRENAEVSLSISLLNNMIKKEQKAHARYVSELEAEHNDKISGLNMELTHIDKQIELNLKEMKNISNKLESTIIKADHYAEKEAAFVQKGVDTMDSMERE